MPLFLNRTLMTALNKHIKNKSFNFKLQSDYNNKDNTNNYNFICLLWLECSPMVQKIGVQSQAESYQRLKKWYLMPPCLALSTIR